MEEKGVIQAKDAAITTVSVEVKVITIGKKQMTLSVFRQLPKVDPRVWWEQASRDQAIHWGTVNYCRDCPPGIASATGEIVGGVLNPSHLHLVWQSGPRLYRTAILEPRADLHFYDPIKGINWGLTHSSYAWWSDEDLAEAERAYADLLRLDQLFIAV